jgi:hypothetical protein
VAWRGVLPACVISRPRRLEVTTNRRDLEKPMRFLVIMMTLLGALSNAAFAADEDPLSALSVLEGSWKVSTQRQHTTFSKEGYDETTVRNDCWRSGGFYVCRQSVDGAERSLTVFAYDPDKKVYHTFPIGKNGLTADAGTLFIKGNVWTYPSTTDDHGTKLYVRTINTFTSESHFHFRQEYSYDEEHWTATVDGDQERLP